MPDMLSYSQHLHVLLDGRIFEEQPLGGISRIYHEILPRICEMNEEIRFSILISSPLRQPRPKHPQINTHRAGFPVHSLLRPQTIFWRAQDYLRTDFQTRSIRHGENTIWHATYFQLPHRWIGPKITAVYDLIPEKFPHFFNKNYDHIFRKRKKQAVLAANKVICISETVRAEVMETYGRSETDVLAVPLAWGDNFRQMSAAEIAASEFRRDGPFILYIGMRDHYKNFRTLLNAYATWPRRKEIQLLVVGTPWSEEEKVQIAAAGLEPYILQRSGVTDEELCVLYNQALAFVYCSLAEGFGIPLLEAMACGCPVVASRIPIFIEVAGDAPYFFDPLNKDELISALDAACFSEKPQSRREDVLARYSWDHNARATLNIYNELAGRG